MIVTDIMLRFPYAPFAFSALTLLVGHQEEHPACKNWVMRCWCGYLSGARCRLFAYGPADATAIPKPHHLLSHINPDWFYLSGTGLPRLSCSSRFPHVRRLARFFSVCGFLSSFAHWLLSCVCSGISRLQCWQGRQRRPSQQVARLFSSPPRTLRSPPLHSAMLVFLARFVSWYQRRFLCFVYSYVLNSCWHNLIIAV